MKLLITTAIAAAALLQPLQAKDKKGQKGHPAPARTAPQVAAHPQAHPKQMHAQAHPQMHQQSHPKAYAQAHPQMHQQFRPKAYAQTHHQQIQHSGKAPNTWQNTAVAHNRSFQKQNHHGPTVAMGGNTSRTNINSQTYNRTEINYARPPENIYRDWDRHHTHSWNNHNYRWYDNAWVIIDSGYDRPGYGYGYGPSVAYSGDLAASVQQALDRRGYDAGYPDGVVGPQTRNAIASFQEDRGLIATGRIDRPLLRALGL
jgi:hypothetical protein